MKKHKEITEALKGLAEAINKYADSIPEKIVVRGNINSGELSEETKKQLENITFKSTLTPDFEKGGVEFKTPNYDSIFYGTKIDSSKILDFDLPRRNDYFNYPQEENPMVDEKPKLEIGKWYRCEGILAVYQGEGVNTYGTYGDKGWLVKATMNWNKNWIPSTKKEVQEALIKEAERRGFKEGMEITDMDGDKEIVEFELANFCSSGNWFELGNPIVFKEGQWAEIIEENKTKTYEVDALPTENIGEFSATMPKKAKSGDTIIIKIH